MADFLLSILGIAINIFFALGILGLVVIFIELCILILKGKDLPNSLPWWVWWSNFRNH